MSEMPLRILSMANVPPDPNSGAAGTVWHTNVALRALGHEVDELWVDDLPKRRIRHGNLHSLLEQPRSYRSALRARLRQRRYDVVQISQPQAYLAARALRQDDFGGVVVNRSHGVELRVETVVPAWHRRLGVAESRSPLLSSALRSLLARQWRGVARDCDGVVVGCEMDRQFLLRNLGMAPERVLAAAHGVAEDFLVAPPPASDPDRWRRILHVGQFAFIKGTHVLAEVVSRTLEAEPQAEFSWVCNAANHDSARKLFPAGIVDRVRLLAQVPFADLVGLYDRHGIFLFPSLFEGFGKAAAEAMARALFVVASDEGGMHDCISNGRDGVLCPVGDVEAFTSATLAALRDPQRAASVGAAAAATGQRLTWGACAAKATDFYRYLLAARQLHGRPTSHGAPA